MKPLTSSMLLSAALMLPLLAQDIVIRRNGDFNPSRRGGQMDVRLRVNGPAQVAIQGGTIRILRFDGMTPRDAGSEMNKELPAGELINLRLDQRDGRSPIRIAEAPSRRNNYTLLLSIDDRQRGDDTREHAHITWDDERLDQGYSNNGSYRERYNRNNDRGSNINNDRYNDRANNGSQNGRFPDLGNGSWNVPGDQAYGNGGTVRWTGSRIPDFLIGNFRGFSRENREGFDLRIDPNGRVYGTSARGNFEGQARDGMIRVGSNKFYVEQTRNGFRTIEVNNESNVTNYRRN